MRKTIEYRGRNLEKIIKYKCSECGELFDTEEMALEHEERHKNIDKANEMLIDGYTLKQINDECKIWDCVPVYLENVNKDNCFTIRHWQCCEKPAYQIVHIFFDGRVNARGYGSSDGYYGNRISLNNRDLNNPRPKEELFIDERYKNRW